MSSLGGGGGEAGDGTTGGSGEHPGGDAPETDWSREQRLQLGRVPLLSREDRAPGALSFTLKIAIGFLQVATSLSAAADIPWPSAFLSFIDAFNVVNLDFLPWSSILCISQLDFYQKLIVVTGA